MGKVRTSDLWSLAAILLGVVAAVSSARAQGLIFHLKNGDRVSGNILSEDTRQVVITNSLYGQVRIPLAEISRREPLPAPPAPAVQTNIVAAPATSPPPAKPKSPPMAPANPEATPIASTPKYWRHDLQFGLNLRYSQLDSQEYLLIAKSTYGKPPFRHIFDYNFSYGRTEGTLSANRMAGSEKSEYQLSDRTYLFSLVGGGYDEIRRIDLQYEFGPGFGYEILNLTNLSGFSKNFVWKTEAGLNYQKQHRADDTRFTAYSGRIAQIAAYRFWDNLTADAKVEFFPNLKDWGEYRLRLEGTLRYPISDRLSLNLVVTDLYDTQPAQNVSPNDLQIRSTIGVKF